MVRNRSETGRYWRWSEIVDRARAEPGRFQLLLPDAPRSVVKTIRLRRTRELLLDDGRLEAYARDEYKDRDGIRRANVYVRFVSDILPDRDNPTGGDPHVRQDDEAAPE